jgi:hypothetical protein
MIWTPNRVDSILIPDRPLDVLLVGRLAWHNITVRHTVVLSTSPGELILRSPDPPLPNLSPGQFLEITFLCREDLQPLQRYAFNANILNMVNDFPTPAGPVAAVVVVYPSPEDIYPSSLRRERRYPVPPGSPLHLWLEGRCLNLLDLSLKGLRFKIDEDLASLKPGDKIKIDLVIDNKSKRINGRVAAVNMRPEGREISMEVGVLTLDVWTTLLETLQKLEQGIVGLG